MFERSVLGKTTREFDAYVGYSKIYCPYEILCYFVHKS